MEKKRRSSNQLLEDAVTSLYESIDKKLKKIDDERLVIEEIFEALKPLRELEDTYRGNK